MVVYTKNITAHRENSVVHVTFKQVMPNCRSLCACVAASPEIIVKKDLRHTQSTIQMLVTSNRYPSSHAHSCFLFSYFVVSFCCLHFAQMASVKKQIKRRKSTKTQPENIKYLSLAESCLRCAAKAHTNAEYNVPAMI